MENHIEDKGIPAVSPERTGSKVRPLTTDERASFVILSVYLFSFCVCSFVYWDSLVLKILGVTAASAGLFLFVAAFFNTEARIRGFSRHPMRSYTIHTLTVLGALFTIRFVGGLFVNPVASLVVIYGGVLVSLVVFRKALVQVVTTLLAMVFLFVTFSNWNAVLVGHMTFKDAVRQCGQVVFRIGPIGDVVDLLVAGNYMGYLSRIDYLDTQINNLATRLVLKTGDNEVRKTRAILAFVSNEIHYVSDPADGREYAKDPINTLMAGGGDCEDQTLLLCSLLESVGVKTYIAFSDEHVFAMVHFMEADVPESISPYVFVDGKPLYALDPAGPGAVIGQAGAEPAAVRRIFDVREKRPVYYSLHLPDTSD
jgi:hypothetical protein